MIAGYAVADGKLRPLADPLATPGEAVWIDLLHPTPEEESAVEAALGVDVPTREEMEEIEVSSRLYTDNGAIYLTALVLAHADGDSPVLSPVTFMLAGPHLVTIRYEEPRAFSAFAARAQKTAMGCASSETALIGILEAIVDRLADVLERAVGDADRLSHEIFHMGAGKPTRPRAFRRILLELGRKGVMASKIRDSLISLSRLFGFLALHLPAHADRETKARVKTLSRDANALTDHAAFLSQKITFLLDAVLGLVNIEQSAIIKIFSVVAAAFLPPTLIASIYGMNFEMMPELSWPIGYPLAIGAMLLSAILPLAYFKRRGWL